MPVMRWIAMHYALSRSRKSRKVGCPRQPDQWSSRAAPTDSYLRWADCYLRLRAEDLRPEDFFADERFDRAWWNLPPLFALSERPIAIACLRLVTFLPLLLFSVPFFLRRIADATRLVAASPYFFLPDFFVQP